MNALQQAARQALSMMDLTTLNSTDTPAKVAALCASANTAFGAPAAICVYPELIVSARQALDAQGLTQVKVATVTNFPDGSEDLARAVRETERAVAAGADEVDVVFPYRALMAGNAELGAELVAACKQACGNQAQLKVIIESGELATPALIRQASEICIQAGADFIKTSTGKVPVNATLEAAEIMLSAIRDSGKACGFKAAGGVRSAAEAQAYLQLAADILGQEWVTPAHFRFGASSLLGSLVATLEGKDSVAAQGY